MVDVIGRIIQHRRYFMHAWLRRWRISRAALVLLASATGGLAFSGGSESARTGGDGPAAGSFDCDGAAVEADLGHVPACVEAVSFASGDLRLAAEWFTPRTGGPFPAAVVIRGSGDSMRGNPWTASLAGVLVEAGLGVLVPDKRGSGASEGDWRTADFVELADDAIAAVRHLSSRSDVLADRVGVMGLSQGGQVAPIAVARSDSVAFAINVVGAAVPFFENVRFEMLRTFEEEGLSDEELEVAMDMVDTAVAYVSGELPWSIYAERLEGTRARVGGGVADEYFIPSPDHWRWDFFRRLADFDPADWWRRVDRPTLVLLGGADRNTPTPESADRLRRLFAETGHPDATVLVFDGLGHDLIDHAAPGPMSEHGLHADVRAALASWARRAVSR